MKKVSSGIIKKILVVLLTFAVIIVVAFLDSDVGKINEALKRIIPLWLVLAGCASLLFFFFDALILKHLCSIMKEKQRWKDTIITTFIGFFYSALTPFQSGGQPFQVIHMRKTGVPVGTSTTIFILKLLAWQFGISTLGILGLCVNGKFMGDISTAENVVMIIGFVCNLSILALAAMLLLKPTWIHAAGNGILSLLHKIKLLKTAKYEKARLSWAKTIDEYKTAIRFAIKNPGHMTVVMLTGLVQAAAFCSITYFIYRGLGMSAHGLVDIILLQAVLTISVSFTPLPGAAGASEGGFYVIFTQFFGAARYPALLLWRLFTYYANIVFGLVAIIVDSFTERKQGKLEDKAAVIPDKIPDGE